MKTEIVLKFEHDQRRLTGLYSFGIIVLTKQLTPYTSMTLLVIKNENAHREMVFMEI